MFYLYYLLVALQVFHAVGRISRSANTTCTELKNHGTHFTVEIGIGTPPQKFDVVADTGSDAIIVPACACVRAGYCHDKSRCFQGREKSATFSVTNGPSGPKTIRMLFGSGPVQAVIASDKVSVASVQEDMTDAVLLMTDHKLKIKGKFEGILGLGCPSSEDKKGLYKPSDKRHSPHSQVNARRKAAQDDAYAAKTHNRAHAKAEGATHSQDIASDVIDKRQHIHKKRAKSVDAANADEIYESDADDVMRIHPTQPDLVPPPTSSNSTKEDIAYLQVSRRLSSPSRSAKPAGISVNSFMENLMTNQKISRFSLCFNDGIPGVFRINPPEPALSHGSIGTIHWGLDFQGISIGGINNMTKMQFCKPEDMKGWSQKTACGAIPDSGTTFIQAPKNHLIELYKSLCDQWPRCQAKHNEAKHKARSVVKTLSDVDEDAQGFVALAASKALTFQRLLYDCKSWLSHNVTLDELPTIYVHIGGSEGTKETLSLKGWAYVIEVHEREYRYVTDVSGHTVPKKVKGAKVCSPAFGTMEYTTKTNGPVWIFGTPLFYSYQVGYDLATVPPSISFSNQRCGSCKPASHTTDHTDHQMLARKVRSRVPRLVNGPARAPSFDLSDRL